jgi:hypothetical protein
VHKQLKWIEKDPWTTSLKKQKERKKPLWFSGKRGEADKHVRWERNKEGDTDTTRES